MNKCEDCWLGSMCLCFPHHNRIYGCDAFEDFRKVNYITFHDWVNNQEVIQ